MSERAQAMCMLVACTAADHVARTCGDCISCTAQPVNAQFHRAARTLQSMHASAACRSKQETQAQHSADTKALQARVAELDKESRELRDTKYALESRVSELSHKVDSQSGQVASLTEEAARLQQQHQAVSRCESGADLPHTTGRLIMHLGRALMVCGDVNL